MSQPQKWWKVIMWVLPTLLHWDEVLSMRSLNCDPAGNKNNCPGQDSMANVKQIIEAIILQIQTKMHTRVITPFNPNGALT